MSNNNGDYWKCDCHTNNLHPPTEKICTHCGWQKGEKDDQDKLNVMLAKQGL